MESQMIERAQPSAEPTLEVANNNTHSTHDALTDLELTISRIEDFLSGPKPEKEQVPQVAGLSSGILAQICQQGADNYDRLQDAHRRISRIASSLGVSQ